VLTRSAAPDLGAVRTLLVAVGAIVCGIAVAWRPTLALAATVLAIGTVACVLVPIRHLPALMLAVTIIMPSLLVEGVGGSGQARAIDLILVLTLARLLLTRRRVVLPGIPLAAVGVAVGLLLMTDLVATTRPAGQVGTSSELVRDLSFPLAAVIGVVGAATARRAGKQLTIVRAFAGLGVLAALASISYWASMKLHVPPPDRTLYSRVAATSTFGPRSIFPFVSDAPNVGAVVFVLLGALAAPPLLESGRRDRWLALLLIASTFAAVLTTQSRTGLVVAGAAGAVYLVLVRGGRRWVVLMCLIALAGASAYVYSTLPAQRRSTATLDARLAIWSQAAGSFLHDPVLGHGYGYSIAGNFVEGPTQGLATQVQSTHSDILSALVDGGMVGGASFIGILILMFTVGRRSLSDPASRPVGIGYLCMLTVFVIGGLGNTLTQSAAAATVEWLSFGVVAGLCLAPGTSRSLALSWRGSRPFARHTGPRAAPPPRPSSAVSS